MDEQELEEWDEEFLNAALEVCDCLESPPSTPAAPMTPKISKKATDEQDIVDWDEDFRKAAMDIFQCHESPPSSPANVLALKTPKMSKRVMDKQDIEDRDEEFVKAAINLWKSSLPSFPATVPPALKIFKDFNISGCSYFNPLRENRKDFKLV